MPWLSVHAVDHPIPFGPPSTKHSQPCPMLESCLAVLKCILSCTGGFYTTWKRGLFREQKQLKQKKPSSSMHFSLLNSKLESNLGDLLCSPPWNSRTQVSSPSKAAQCCRAEKDGVTLEAGLPSEDQPSCSKSFSQ